MSEQKLSASCFPIWPETVMEVEGGFLRERWRLDFDGTRTLVASWITATRNGHGVLEVLKA